MAVIDFEFKGLIIDDQTVDIYRRQLIELERRGELILGAGITAGRLTAASVIQQVCDIGMEHIHNLLGEKKSTKQKSHKT